MSVGRRTQTADQCPEEKKPRRKKEENGAEGNRNVRTKKHAKKKGKANDRRSVEKEKGKGQCEYSCKKGKKKCKGTSATQRDQGERPRQSD